MLKRTPLEEGSLPLLSTAGLAFCWIVARACIQSITIDEADTYLAYVRPARPTYWEAAANNHVLNSLLMRLSTSLLGVSNFSLRLPAVLGAALYITAAYVLVRLMTRSLPLAWGLLVCLVSNPFVMDYLVAARGYSLALAFLMAALAYAAWRESSGADPLRTCAVCSAAIALSFAANFSFAIADAVTLAGIALWCASGKRSIRHYARIAAAAIVPGLLVALYLTGAILAHWPRNEFRWGATTFQWSMQTIGEQSFHKLSPYLVPEPPYEFLLRHRHLLLPLLGLACLWRLIVLVRTRPAEPDGSRAWLVRLGLVTGAGVVLAVALHGVLVAAFHMLWPRGRTGLFVPPLAILAVGALASIPCVSKMGIASRRVITALVAAIGCYFILCLRLTWFDEWYWNAGSDRLYHVVAYYNHTYGVRQIGTNWRYVAVLEFQRVLSEHETLEPVALERPIPGGRSLYVLFPADDDAFMRQQGLKLVYHDPLSDAMVAIRPELEVRVH